MDIALIVLGVLAFAVLVIWAYTFMSDPKEIDEQEEQEVRAQTPEERERAALDEAGKAAESNADDIVMYSPGEGIDE